MTHHFSAFVAIAFVYLFAMVGVDACQTEILSSVHNISSSLAMINNRPAVAYINHFDHPTDCSLHYIRSLDTHGFSWPGSITTLASTQVLEATLMAINGKPAILSLEIASTFRVDIIYRRSGDTDGTQWITQGRQVEALQESFGSYRFLQIAMVELQLETVPLVFFYGKQALGDRSLYAIRATSETGQDWKPADQLPVTITPSSYFWRITFSVTLFDGFPTMAFVDDGGDLRLLKAMDKLGQTWNSNDIVLIHDAFATVNPILIAGNAQGTAYAVLAVDRSHEEPLTASNHAYIFVRNPSCTTTCPSFQLSQTDHLPVGWVSALTAAKITDNVIAYQYTFTVGLEDYVFLGSFQIDTQQVRTYEIYPGPPTPGVRRGLFGSVANNAGTVMSVFYGGSSSGMNGIDGDSLVFNGAIDAYGQDLPVECTEMSLIGTTTTVSPPSTTVAATSSTAANTVATTGATTGSAPSNPSMSMGTFDDTRTGTTAAVSTASGAGANTTPAVSGSTDTSTVTGADTSPTAAGTTFSNGVSSNSNAAGTTDNTMSSSDPDAVGADEDETLTLILVGAGAFVCALLLVGFVICLFCVFRRRRSPEQRTHASPVDVRRPGPSIPMRTSFTRRGAGSSGARSRRRSGATGLHLSNSRSSTSRRSFTKRAGGAGGGDNQYAPAPNFAFRKSSTNSRASSRGMTTYDSVPQENYVPLKSMASPAIYSNAPAHQYSPASPVDSGSSVYNQHYGAGPSIDTSDSHGTYGQLSIKTNPDSYQTAPEPNMKYGHLELKKSNVEAYY